MCRLCNPSCTCTSTLHKRLALRVAQATQLTEILRVRTWLSTSIREPLRNELRAVRSRSGGSMKHYTKHVWMLGLLAATACVTEDDTSASTLESQTSIPNNHPFQNSLGTSATFSTAGSVDLTNEFFQEFGTNGRHCGH